MKYKLEATKMKNKGIKILLSFIIFLLALCINFNNKLINKGILN